VRATDRPDQHYEVTILDSPVANAFALPNGRLYVTRGLLALANDTSEVAGVLAHEISHVTLSHAAARTELALRSTLVTRVVEDVLRDPQAGSELKARSQVAFASFSRSQELEADQVGVRTLVRAGFDPYGAVRFLETLNRNATLRSTALGDKGGAPDMLATHPGTPERIALAREAARVRTSRRCCARPGTSPSTPSRPPLSTATSLRSLPRGVGSLRFASPRSASAGTRFA
jgi:predicted Zn-dependent protease